MKTLARFVATAGFVGHAPLAPGTAGSLVALPIAWLVFPWLSPYGLMLALLCSFGIALWAAGQQVSGDQKDPQHVVIDEVIGQMVTLLFVPPTFATWAAGFVLFRLFDVVKPFPARQSEKLVGGWGIVIDDVIAGIYANLALRILIYFVEL
jgi:phosphatidylglycerophosphatase A